MPEMDGYEATRVIIDYEKNDGLKHTPIIAVTANAMKGDDKKCLEAGMDDYISKPVQPDMIIDVITRWLPDHGVTKSGLIKKEAAKRELLHRNTEQDNLIDSETLSTLRILTGDSYIQVLKSYINMLEKTVTVMSKALLIKDGEILLREAHTLNPAADKSEPYRLVTWPTSLKAR